MKTDRIPSNPHPFSRTCALLRVGCAALFTTAALLANPPGHQKLILGGYSSDRGYSLSIDEYSDVLLTSSGTTFFNVSYGSSLYSVTPTSFAELLGDGLPAPTGRYLDRADVDRAAVNKRGDVAFFSGTDLEPPSGINGLEGKSGIFLMSGGVVKTIADQGTGAPGGGLFNDSYPDIRISNNGRFVVFRSGTSGGPGSGVYIADVSGSSILVKPIAVVGDNSPDGGKFTGFVSLGDSLAVINNGTVVFDASTTLNSSFESPLFSWDGSSIKSIPGTEYLNHFQINDSGNLMVVNFDGIKYGTVSKVNQVIENGVTISGIGKLWVESLNSGGAMLDNSGAIAFTADILSEITGDSLTGIFLWTPSGLTKIMLTSDSPPGGGLFDTSILDLYPIAIDGSKVCFQSDTSGGTGIFKGDGTKLEKIIRTGDILEGQAVTNVFGYGESEKNIADQGAYNQNGQVVYYAELENDVGLFIYPYVPPPTFPEITVKLSSGKILTDNKSGRSFGKVKLGRTSKVKKFTIQNSGTATLSGLAVMKNGSNASDFKVSKLAVSSLAPGKSTTFKVTFKPKKKGNRNAAIHIRSNDTDENPFDIKFYGTGVKK